MISPPTDPPTARAQPVYDRLRTALLDVLRGGSTFLFLSYMLGNAIAYGYQMVMSRTLPPGEYGGLVALTSVFYVLSVAVKAIQAWIIGAVAGTGGQRRVHPGLAMLGALRVVLPFGIVVLVAHYFGSHAIASFLNIDDSLAVVVLGLYVCTEFLEALVAGVSMGLGRPRLAGLIVIIEPITRVFAGLTMVVLGLGLTGAMLGFPLGNLAGFVFALVVLWSLLRGGRGDSRDTRLPQPLDRYALAVLVANVGLMALINVDQVLVKHFFSAEAAANYAVAWVLGRVIAITTMSFGWVVFSSSASLDLDDPRRVKVLVRGLLTIGSVAGAVTAVYFLAGGLLVSILSGPAYTTAPHYVGLIGVELSLFALTYVQAYYHLSVRRVKVAWLLLAAVALEVGLLTAFHSSIEQVLTVLIAVMAGLLVAISILTYSLFREPVRRFGEGAQRVKAPSPSEVIW